MSDLASDPLKVLIVDDDPVDRELIKRAFKDSKANVALHFCESGASALKLLQRNKGGKSGFYPDACIFDINMPGLSGIELLDKIKSDPASRSLPVVMLSSSDDQKDIEASYAGNASSYVCKPDNYRELREMISAITRFWAETVSYPSRIQAWRG